MRLLLGTALIAAGCAEPPFVAPTDTLPAADPGFLLSVSAPTYGLSTDWDMVSGKLIVGDDFLWSIDLVTRVATRLPSPPIAVSPGIIYLQVGQETGAIFTTAGQRDGTHILSRLDRGAVKQEELSRISSQAFVISRNGHWLVFSERGTNLVTRLDTRSGSRVTVPTSVVGNGPYLIDDSGRQLSSGLCTGTCDNGVLDFDTGLRRTFTAPPTIENIFSIPVRQAAFEGTHLLFLLARAEGSTTVYFEWDETTRTERVVMRLTVDVPYWTASCMGWSPTTHSVVAVVRTADRGYLQDYRYTVYALVDGVARPIRTANLFNPTSCSLSPDGKWFAYGNTTGYVSGGGRRYYLTPVP